MIQFLLNFLGVKIQSAQEVSSVSLQLRNAGWLGWVVFIALLLGGFSWWVYRYLGGHRDLQPPRRKLLTSLRIALFLLLLFMLLRPVFSFTVENRLRRKLIVMLDKSASMDIPDPRLDDADIKRAAIAKGMIEKLDDSLDSQSATTIQHSPRSELVTAAFENSRMNLLKRLKKNYDLEFFNFDRIVSPISEDDAINKKPVDDDLRQATAIGDAIRDGINRERGQPVAGILLVTDGGNNLGSEPLDAATAAGGEKTPLYIYGVGITSPRDIIVDGVFTPDVAFIKDEVPVTVRVRGQNLKGQTARLSLKLGDDEVASTEVTFTDDAEMAVPMTFTPQKAGEFDLTASIPPRDDETVKDNNSASQRLRVIDSKIKVLFVERAPRWEFRFLQSVLLRDRRINAKFLLIQGNPAISQAEGSPFIAKFPQSKEDLFKYDLIVLGDVDAKTFTPDQLDWMNEFVSKFGGAMGFIAGQQYNPASYAGTTLEKLLPVELGAPSSMQESGGRSTTLAPTSIGLSSPMLKLASDDQENAEIWKSFPPIKWIYRVARAKPGAQVMLEDTDPAKTTRFGRMPAMALQQYGVGQTLFMGTDDTWRWRQETGVAYYPLFWGQVVQRLALAHLLGGSKRTQLSVDKQHYNTTDRVTVFARLYDEAFEPVNFPSVNGTYLVEAQAGQPASQPQSVQLRALPDQPGMFRGDFVALTPGTYKFAVESDNKTSIEFAVTKSRFELGETAMNEPLLKAMAQASDGAFFREEDLAMLPDKLSQKDERLSRVVDADIWSSPFYFLLLTAIVVTEWIMRKKSELKPAATPNFVLSLHRRIVAVRQKRAVVKTITGIAIAIAVLIGVMTGETLLDALVELPWIARAVILFGALGGSGFLLWREAIQPLRNRLNDDAIASMIEHALPAFRTRFIASLQLARAAGKEPPQSLVRALLAETAAMAATQDFRQVVKTRKLRRSMLTAVGVVAVASGLAWFGGSSSILLLKRALLFNIPLPHKTHIISVTGDRKIGVGEDMEINVTAGGALPTDGQVIATTASGLTRQFELAHDPDHREKYSVTIHSPQESFSYYVKLNDDTSAKYQVQTILRPAVSSVTTEQTYPSYVNLAPVKRSTGDLSLLAGSKLKVFIKASTQISKATLHLTGLEKDQPLSIDAADPTSLSGEIAIPSKDLTGFSVHLVDTHGVESGESATYRIDVVPDQPPTVDITYPTHHEELATPQATLLIAFEAKDDFGVVKAVLHYTVNQGAEKTIDFAPDGSAEKDIKRKFDWKLTSLKPNLVIGDALEWWVTVADGNIVTGPGLGTTDHYEYKIVSEDEKRLDIQNRLRDTIGGLKDIEQEQEDAARALSTPLFEKPKQNP